MAGWFKKILGTSSSSSATKHVIVKNVVVAVDVSSSIPQSMLDFVRKEGIPAIVKSMCGASRREHVVYNFCLITFGSEVKVAISPTDVTKIDPARDIPHLESRGVTLMEDAMWKAFAEIDRLKAEQDKTPGTARRGSLLVCVTDGCPTDEHGSRKELSNYLVREIKRRSSSRSCETFAIGLGSVDDDTLRKIGPATSYEGKDGKKYTAAHAVRYEGSADDSKCWSSIYKLVGEASSSAAGKRVVAYTDDQSAWMRQVETIRVDPSEFRIIQ